MFIEVITFFFLIALYHLYLLFESILGIEVLGSPVLYANEMKSDIT